MAPERENWYGLELAPYVNSIFTFAKNLGPAGVGSQLSIRQVQMAALWYFSKLDRSLQLDIVRSFLEEKEAKRGQSRNP